MLKTKLLFPCPFLVEAYRNDKSVTLIAFDIMFNFPNYMSVVDYMYAYMIAKEKGNKYEQKKASYFEKKLEKYPDLVEDAIRTLDSNVVALWSVEDSSVDELTKEVISSMRITANFFAKNGNYHFNEILAEKGIPPIN